MKTTIVCDLLGNGKTTFIQGILKRGPLLLSMTSDPKEVYAKN
jgi:tRNA A37 threonylcarbamoyladenosine biosynthesis protein TsaE